MRNSKGSLLIISFVCLAALVGTLVSTSAARVVASATVVTVNSSLDVADPTPGDGVCDVDPGTPGLQCTLRAAIQTAQAGAVPAEIRFSGDMDITLLTPLPELTLSGVSIIAESDQTVRIHGNGISSNVFRINGVEITLQGLAIYGSGEGWSNIWIRGDSHSVIIASNLIGIPDAADDSCGASSLSYGGIFVDATAPVPEGGFRAHIYGNTIACHDGAPGEGVTVYATDGVIVGSSSLSVWPDAERNTLRQNNAGVVVTQGQDNALVNNHIHNNGVGVLLENAGFSIISGSVIEYNTGDGIEVVRPAGATLIGCIWSDADLTVANNLLRGNGGAGVAVWGAPARMFVRVGVACNWIGLDDDGQTPVPNRHGILLTDGAPSALVTFNVISGNLEDGLHSSETMGDHQIAGNIIGLDLSGMIGVPNGSHGVSLINDGGNTIIGPPPPVDPYGSLAGSGHGESPSTPLSSDAPHASGSAFPPYEREQLGNLISGNNGYGILVSNTPTTTVVGNYIGLAVDGLTRRGNENSGIAIFDSVRAEIGGWLDVLPQVVAGNGGDGLMLQGATETTVGGEQYLVDNGGHGIYVFASSGNWLAPEQVSGNGNAGIRIMGETAYYNFVWPARIFGNGGLPIELGLDGLEPNDPGDIDDGPNHMLNYPEVDMISDAIVTGSACAECAILVYEAIGDPTRPGGGGIYRSNTAADAAGIWTFDLAAAGLAYRPVSFMAIKIHGIGLFSTESSPLSPLTQIGWELYLPLVNR